MVKFFNEWGHAIEVDSNGNLVLEDSPIVVKSELEAAVNAGLTWDQIKPRIAAGISKEMIKENHEDLYYRMLANETTLGRLLYG
jgi:hypothetical protein